MEHSRHQQGIIRRYYEHHETIMINMLGETVSELYLCEDRKKADKLWEGVRKTLTQLKVPPSRISQVCGFRKPEMLAELVTELTVPGSSPESAAGKGPDRPATGPLAVSGHGEGSLEAAPAGLVDAASTLGGDVASGGGGVTPDVVKSALKAFRKRLKLTRLDAESEIGSRRNPLSGGARSGIVAIQPPTQFSREVWEELVRQGKLKAAGRGFYELVGE